ncbi:MAG: hypothetical protein Q9197_000192 [Variospora fuerteventurae]
MVGSFLPMFRALHPNRNTPVETSFRLRLLQFACPGQSEYEDHGKGLSSRSSIEGPRQDLALQASLPSFLALSAVQNALQESTITELWMRLAAGYMAQAYAEQVLEYHNSRSDLLENTFRWSFDHECVAEEGSDEWLINEMFDADANVINLWEKIKNEHIRALLPPDGIPLTAHLKAMVSGRLSVSTFKEKISEFLMGLLAAHPLPLLTQIEIGTAEGLSPKVTEMIKKKVGFT